MQDQKGLSAKRAAPAAIPTPLVGVPFRKPLLSSNIQNRRSRQEVAQGVPNTRNSTYSLLPLGPCEISLITICPYPEKLPACISSESRNILERRFKKGVCEKVHMKYGYAPDMVAKVESIILSRFHYILRLPHRFLTICCFWNRSLWN